MLKTNQNIGERYLRRLERFGIPKYVSAQIMIFLPYIIWRFIANLWVGSQVLPLTSIFIIRDLLAIVILSPLYIYFLDRIREASDGLATHMDSSWLPRNLYSNFFSDRLFVTSGLIAGLFYIGVTSWYVSAGFYGYDFYIERLISAFGVFFLGGIIYQGLILANVLVRKARRVELRVSALIEGLKPITSIGLAGSVGWLAGITLITLPVQMLGFSSFGGVWYVGFYGTLYISGLFIFFAVSWGFHKAMLASKSSRVAKLGNALNSHYPTYERSIISSGSSDEEIESLITVYSHIANGKEWPFEWQNVIDVLLFNLLPVAISFLGSNL